MPRPSSHEREDDLLQLFRRWIHSLSVEELLKAMEFEFIRGNDGRSDDYNLLKQMVETQAPPPTPIHARAMGFHPAFCSRITTISDGRDEERRILRERLQKPRLFKFIELVYNAGRSTLQRKTARMRQTMKQKKYDVIARKFVTPSGEVLSLGCTSDQRESDEAIVLRTRLYIGADGQIVRGSFSSGNNDDKKKILNHLRIASRGAFLTTVVGKSDKESFFSPWLNPTENFFSLSKYIASRLEVALWSSFRGIVMKNSALTLQDAASKLSQDAIKLAWCKAIVRALSANIFPSDAKLSNVRDGLIWRLIIKEGTNLSFCSVKEILPKCADFIKLIDLGTVNDELTRKVLPLVQEEMSLQIERELVNGCSDFDIRKTKIIRNMKLKKKRRRRENQSQKLFVAESLAQQHPPDESFGNECADVDLIIRFDEKGPSADKTRKTLIALSIIEECIERAIQEVGVPTEVKESEGDVHQGEDKILKQNRETVIPISSDILHQAIKAADSPVPLIQNQIPKWPTPIEGKTEATFQGTNVDLFSFLGKSQVSSITVPNEMQTDNMEAEFFNSSIPSGMTWNFDGTFDEFDRSKGNQGREKSIFAEFFMKGEHPRTCDERNEASSTAASIASSTDIDKSDNDDDASLPLEGGVPVHIGPVPAIQVLIDKMKAQITEVNDSEIAKVPLNFSPESLIDERSEASLNIEKSTNDGERTIEINSPTTSTPSLEAPRTPSPLCSPILVSLEDLKQLREQTRSIDIIAVNERLSPRRRTHNAAISGSLPSSPTPISVNPPLMFTPCHSRDDLQVPAITEDHHLKSRNKILPRYADALLSYKNPLITRSTPRPHIPQKAMSDLGISEFPRHSTVVTIQPDFGSRTHNQDSQCAKSETAIETYMEDLHWIESPESPRKVEVDNVTATKEGSMSIISKREIEDNVLLEERNTFRDLCLTLGAEVAKLKNLLAAQQGGLLYHGMGYTSGPQDVMQNSSYDRAIPPTFFNGISRATANVGAMSDAGVHRSDLDAALSDDGTDAVTSQDIPRRPQAIHVRRVSSGGTISGSDISVDQPVPKNTSRPHGSQPLNRDAFGSFPVHGIQSRLTRDIVNFLNSTSLQLRNQDTRRQAAIERLSRLVNALWPRAQVKLYGSHVTGLSLPSSDLDFVVCLPAVHKNAPAVAPGVLEGRNAINESSQKLLSRKLKGESWIDPRSIKIIDRTVVPVIKVSTKDTRSRMLQLDISFAGPEHHGLEAIEMITEITHELPMVRPLVLVLKQFLFDRGLLTAYTGGLSSYCLFLMVTRYLQEQSTSWDDCGSLLMGFLDFYGNSFDPRATGLSVRRRQYFARTIFARQYQHEQPLWTASHQPHHAPSPLQVISGSRPDFLRRHSFSDKGDVDANAGIDATRSVPANFHGTNGGDASRSVHAMRPPRYQAPYRHSAHFPPPPGQGHHNNAAHASARPYTFDPLFVEDPLSMGNNVGRNAFRIFQVQRAFSDAHRALLASLEWDHYSTHDFNDDTGDYPLLKCLLQSEDVFYDIEDIPPR